jgi:hypothetical protein
MISQHGLRNASVETDNNREQAARRIDHASLMEASRARVVASRKLCLSTAVAIREARVTIKRTLELLGIGLPPKVPRADLAAASRLRQCTGDEDEGAVGIG